MTVKEISEFTRKNETTVRRWVNKAALKNEIMAGKMTVSNSTNPADYTIDEV